jgi:hypothetical protein
MSRPTVETDRGRLHCEEITLTGKKIVTLALLLFVVFFVVNSPKDAADIVKSSQHILAHGFTSMSEFVKNL